MFLQDISLQQGQIGLITLLLMTVVISIALGLSVRTVMEQDIAYTQDESVRVFNAAESGIEQALYEISMADISVGLTNINLGANYEVVTKNSVNISIESGRAIEVPLNQTNTIVDINWWNKTDTCADSNQPAAIMVSVYSATGVKFYGYDPCSRGNFEEVTVNSSPITFEGDDHYYTATINVTTDDVLIRVRPLYNNTKLYITSAAFVDAQYDITSSGYTEELDLARTLQVKRSMPGAPDFMDFALVSGEGLIKD